MKPSRMFLLIVVGLAIGATVWGTSDAKEYRYINIATASIGGTFYPMGGGMADVLTKNLPKIVGYRVTASIQATGGSAENVRLIDRGRAELALANASSAYEGYHGIGIYRKEGKKKISGMFAVYPSPVQIVTLASSNIKNIMDIKGKRVGLGPPGGGTENDARNIVKSLGMSYGDFKEAYLSFAEMGMSLRDNVLDVAFHTVGMPAASLVDLSSTRKIRILEFTPEQLKKLTDAFPYYYPFTIPAGTYRTVDNPVRSIMTPVIMICQTDMPEDLIYNITKVLYENRKRLVEVHASAKWIKKDFLSQVAIPFHPGAKRFLREIGALK